MQHLKHLYYMERRTAVIEGVGNNKVTDYGSASCRCAMNGQKNGMKWRAEVNFLH